MKKIYAKTINILFLGLLNFCCNSALSRPQLTLNFSFFESENWLAGFADYPAGEEDYYELSFGYTNLPDPLSEYRGVFLSGTNHSDDLFMYVKSEISNLLPNTKYEIKFLLTIATNAPNNCVGIGGAPGESVAIKAGIASQEPLVYVDDQNYFRMTIDKGFQSSSGKNALYLGNFANNLDCSSSIGERIYMLKSLTSNENSLILETGNDGSAWIIFATDSGFEGNTKIYFVDATVYLILD